VGDILAALHLRAAEAALGDVRWARRKRCWRGMGARLRRWQLELA